MEAIVNLFEQKQGFTTREGGSTFQAINLVSPLGFPSAIITVLFRPFPWEADSILSLLQSMEGIALAGLCVWRIKSLAGSFRYMFSNVYLRFIVFYIVVFVIVFTFVLNFGILVRQRTMVLPFLFMILAFNPSDVHIENKGQEVPIR
jgi:hypothetical protein